MTDETTPQRDGTLADETVREMVRTLEPNWAVESIERSAHGTDFVATLGVETPGGARTVVLKATTAGLVAPVVARAEPRLLALVGRETSIPVPAVFGRCDDHEAFPAPFYLMSHVEGENYEGRPERLDTAVRERILRDAGRYLAELHSLGPLSGAGRLGVRGGRLTVLDTEEFPRYDDSRDWLLSSIEDTLDSLADGGFFPELAERPERFADLVPPLRIHVRETVPELPAPAPPTYCHTDYRYGNLLVDPETGATRAVLDWANLSATDPAYNLASAESLLLTPETDSQERTARLRRAFRTAYAEHREDWSFDAATRERIETSRLACRLAAMACLPLWYRDGTRAERDERAAEHRAFVARHLDR